MTDTPITTVETVITTNEDIPVETMGDIGEVVEAETLTEVSRKIILLYYKSSLDIRSLTVFQCCAVFLHATFERGLRTGACTLYMYNC